MTTMLNIGNGLHGRGGNISKIIVSIVLMFCVSISLISCAVEKEHSFDENDYLAYLEEVNQSKLHMPNLDEIGEYQNIEIHLKRDRGPIWPHESIALVVKYDETNYNDECDKILKQYEFLNIPNKTIQDVDSQMGTYIFRIVDKDIGDIFDKDYYSFPHAFLIIGFDNENHSIAYLFHYDSEVDYIDDLDDFIKEMY